MPTIRIPEWAKAALGLFLSVVAAAISATWIARGAYAELQSGVEKSASSADAAQKAADAALGEAHALVPRVTSLETSRAVQDERWTHVLRVLEELRADVKVLKGR